MKRARFFFIIGSVLLFSMECSRIKKEKVNFEGKDYWKREYKIDDSIRVITYHELNGRLSDSIIYTFDKLTSRIYDALDSTYIYEQKIDDSTKYTINYDNTREKVLLTGYIRNDKKYLDWHYFNLDMLERYEYFRFPGKLSYLQTYEIGKGIIESKGIPFSLLGYNTFPSDLISITDTLVFNLRTLKIPDTDINVYARIEEEGNVKFDKNPVDFLGGDIGILEIRFENVGKYDVYIIYELISKNQIFSFYKTDSIKYTFFCEN